MDEAYIQIGQILKDRRLKKNVSIEKISNKTKISIQNLINIEEGKFHLIGGRFYQKSFIKTYAKALRISERKILLLFEDSDNPKKKAFIEDNEEDSEKIKTSIITEKVPTIPLVFFASFVVIGLILFNFFKVDTKHDNQLTKITPKQDIKISEIEEEIIDEIENNKHVTSIKKTNVNTNEFGNYKMEEDAIFIKKIIAKEDVWIEIKDNNKNILISTILKKDESFDLPNDKKDIIISASNAAALFIKNGNNDFPDLGPPGTILESVDLNSLITNH